MVPIAFVSEHSETLVELDIEYREEAKHFGVPAYFRAPAQNSDAGFIASLASLVRRTRGLGAYAVQLPRRADLPEGARRLSPRQPHAGPAPSRGGGLMRLCLPCAGSAAR
ncbi:MAG: ferrochelatase [Acetobacteraceae bacterium]|nr:ferrochelatase [Acetobacteraceae bacterium]